MNDRGHYGKSYAVITLGKEPGVIREGHRRAARRLSLPLLGVPDGGALSAGTGGFDIQARLGEVFRALVKTHGAVAGSPGLPKLSATEYNTLVTAFIEAVREGLADTSVPITGYVISADVKALPRPHLADQKEPFEVLLGTEFFPLRSTEACLPVKPTDLAWAVRKMLRQRFIARTRPPELNLEEALKAVSYLAEQMDVQGVSFKKPDLLEEVKHSAEKLPERIQDTAKKVASTLGYGGLIAIGAVVVLGGGYLLAKRSKS